MPLATLAAVKAKLGIPASVTDQDAGIQAVLDAAELWLLARTRYDLAGGTMVDTLNNVPTGAAVPLRKRPVTALLSVEGQALGDTSWTTLSAALRDANAGTLVVLGADGAAAWPPTVMSVAPWFRWRVYPVWPLVRVTYTVSPLTPVPADLADLAAALAAYWYDRDRAGAAREVDLDPTRTAYHEATVPPWVYVRLARHLPVPALAGWV